MKRIHKNMLTAAILLAAGGGFGLYTLQEKVKTPEERFRDQQDSKRLFKFGRIHVRKATLHAKNATVTFEGDGEDWTIVEPTKWPADKEAIDAMLDRMAALVVDPVTTENATAQDLKTAGLDKPQVTLEVQLDEARGGKKSHTLYVGPRNKLADKYPVTDGDKKRLGLSEPTFYWALDRNLDELRDKRLVALTEKSVTKIQVLEPDGSVRFTVEKKSEDEWTTSGPKTEPIAADAGEVLLLSVRVTKRLKAKTFVRDDFDPKSGELGEHLATLVLEGPTKHRIVFAHAPGREDVVVAHLEGTGTVAEVDPEIVHGLEKKPLDLRDRTLHRFDASNVHKIRLEQSGTSIVIERNDAKNDWLIGAEKKPAKIWQVDAIARGFSYLKVDSIHAVGASKKQLVEWLLDPPSRRIVFEDASGKTLADVHIGKYGTETHIFVKGRTDERVGLLPDKKVAMLPKAEKDLIDEER